MKRKPFEKIPMGKSTLPPLPEGLDPDSWCGVSSTDWRLRWRAKTGNRPGHFNLFEKYPSYRKTKAARTQRPQKPKNKRVTRPGKNAERRDHLERLENLKQERKPS